MTGPNDPRWNEPKNSDGDTFDQFFADRRPQYDGSDEFRRTDRADDETMIAPQRNSEYTVPLPTAPLPAVSNGAQPPTQPRYYDQATDPEPRRTSAWLPAAIIIVSLLALAAVAYYAFGRGTSNSNPTTPAIPTATSTAPGNSSTSSSDSSSASSSSDSSSSSESSSASSPTSSTPSSPSSSSPATTLPAGLQACSTTVAAANGTTCEFANNVAAAVAGVDTSSGGDFGVTAFSPATKKDYMMKCTQSEYIQCTSTTGSASVFILRK